MQQVETLFEQGTEIASRIYLFFNIHLYVMDNFFVEIWYKQISNKIERLVVLDAEDVVDIYNKEIGLDDLFK